MFILNIQIFLVVFFHILIKTSCFCYFFVLSFYNFCLNIVPFFKNRTTFIFFLFFLFIFAVLYILLCLDYDHFFFQ